MIPKPLNEIEWSDIEALMEVGREEDDTIEFKGSFSGGPDFLDFNEKQQAAAVDGIAKEAIAFLNGRGGDILIGVKEFKNEHPKIEALTPISNAVATVDRLAQALAAIIEPVQSVLSVRAIVQSPECDEGVILIRAPASLRAPHRSKRTKDCYVRRGRESVPMPMDEVQDVTLQRNFTRAERNVELERLFSSFDLGRVRREVLTGERFQMRLAYLPLAKLQIELNDRVLREIFNGSPHISHGDQKFDTDFEFQSSGMNWIPVLRGRGQSQTFGSPIDEYYGYIGREIGVRSTVVFDGSWRMSQSRQTGSNVDSVVKAEWLIDFLASAVWALRELVAHFPTALPGLIQVRMMSVEAMRMAPGKNLHFHLPLDEALIAPEPFDISDVEDLGRAFVQLQHDIFALIERAPSPIYALGDRQ